MQSLSSSPIWRNGNKIPLFFILDVLHLIIKGRSLGATCIVKDNRSAVLPSVILVMNIPNMVPQPVVFFLSQKSINIIIITFNTINPRHDAEACFTIGKRRRLSKQISKVISFRFLINCKLTSISAILAKITIFTESILYHIVRSNEANTSQTMRKKNLAVMLIIKPSYGIFKIFNTFTANDIIINLTNELLSTHLITVSHNQHLPFNTDSIQYF